MAHGENGSWLRPLTGRLWSWMRAHRREWIGFAAGVTVALLLVTTAPGLPRTLPRGWPGVGPDGSRIAQPLRLEERARSQTPGTGTSTGAGGAGPEGAATLSPTDQAVVEVVRRVSPAVVKVAVTESATLESFFFGTPPRKGIGSGVILDPSGLIVTNHHVVAGAESIHVVLPDTRGFVARVVGLDPLTDLALLRADTKGERLPVAELAPPNSVQVGQSVIAIGNPFGLDFSVTTGVISALDRDIPVDPEQGRFLQGVLQTDASINPGNSGGPLLDMAGRVVGINTAIASQAQGIGFSVPAATVRSVVEDLMASGRVIRVGALGQRLSPEVASAYERSTGQRLPVKEGAMITAVVEGSPAHQAGLRKGDIVTHVEGKPVRSVAELDQQVRRAGSGGPVRLTLFRGGQRMEPVVVIGH